MSIGSEDHLSMGNILRSTIQRARNEATYAHLLENSYQISDKLNIFDCLDSTPELIAKVRKHLPRVEAYFQRENMQEFTSQLDWLEYCTMNGLLVPDRWTQNFIAAHIEDASRFLKQPFIIDGYPRTVKAAEHLLSFLNSQGIPVIKVLHLSISKQEMLTRARARGREDDDTESLLSRYNFYVENVQPSVDYIKTVLGSEAISLIDAHQPVFDLDDQGKRHFNLHRSIANVVASALRSLGVPRVIVRDIAQDFIFQRQKNAEKAGA